MTAQGQLTAQTQAFNLLVSLFDLNKYELDPELEAWLKSESGIISTADEKLFDATVGQVLEGIFRAVRDRQAAEPEGLWNAALDRFAQESGKRVGDGQADKPLKLHDRLLCLYWMLRLATEGLIEHEPNVRLVRVLLAAERELREAFIHNPDDLPVPRHLVRKRQWKLLDEYGMGLRLEELYDLSPPKERSELSPKKLFWFGLLLGLIIGFVLGVWWARPPGP